jgi:SAM-dependent methyltransferase
MEPRADYGIDAPGVVRNFFLLAGACFVAAGLAAWLLPWLLFPPLCVGLTFGLQGGVMLWGSKVGKLRLRDRVLDALALRGDERVLDAGCGHGLLLLGAARRLTKGKAVGIDLWQKEDQAGNSREATMENARREGVADRVELHDGDARDMPFPDGSFDVVVSSWVIHNIYDRQGRTKALREIVRVLKSPGRLALVDIRHTTDYADELRKAGLRQVKRSSPNFLFVIPSHVVTAEKPGEWTEAG